MDQDIHSLAGIAIVGMACRFPGADSPEELWHNLCQGIESTTFFADEDLDPHVDVALRQDRDYVKAHGVVREAESFDATFFGINPREAEVMDPQGRVFLELVWEALENAGVVPDTFHGSIGLYAGSGKNTYFAEHLWGRRDVMDRVGDFQVMLANEKDFLTTLASYKLNLNGPSVAINTACSTSLVATIHAFQDLLNYQCDLALAGGVSITTPQNRGYLAQEGGMLSPDGHCRPFDIKAQGTIFNNGAGLVVLKRVEDAVKDGDRIYAVIRGTGINNDGAHKVSFTAPSVAGQAAAIAMAQAFADFHPETLSYLEAHGTATPLGDPIEFAALRQVFERGTTAKQFCALGSIKYNVGHMVAAAGVAGLIKTALALYHRQIPPSPYFVDPNPELDLANSPFYINTLLIDWPRGSTPRRAGVSSFGVGGTNAHVVLEEAPSLPKSDPSRPVQVLLLSGKTPTALDAATLRLQTFLQDHRDLNFADIAYTLQRGRQSLSYRRWVVARNGAEAVEQLTLLRSPMSGSRLTETHQPPVVFMFPGQGSQYPNMGYGLYRDESVFRQAVDRCAQLLQSWLDLDLRSVLYPRTDQWEEAAGLLRQTWLTQPALFVVEYALAQLWMSWGIVPQAMIGHSIGEWVAACLAGVLALEDALRLVALRGRLMQDLPPGGMLSVRMSASHLGPRLHNDLAIAAVNGPSLCVVSGPHPSLAALQAALEAEGVVSKPLHTSHAFHSPMMDPIIAPLTTAVQSVDLHPPHIPFVSTVTGDWITAQQATDPHYWAQQLRHTVQFAAGIQTLWQQPERVLLEVGPRTTATLLARQHIQDPSLQIAIASLPQDALGDDEWLAMMQAIGQLWAAGVALNWDHFYAAETRHRLPLPTYPFERQRYWIDPKPDPVSLPPERTPALTLPDAPPPLIPVAPPRRHRLVTQLKTLLEETSGLDVSAASETTPFWDIGFDSLTLTQVALALKKPFGVKVSFRQLMEEFSTLGQLAEFIDGSLPPEPSEGLTTPQTQSAHSILPPSPVKGTPLAESRGVSMDGIAGVIAQQLSLMAQQLELLKQSGVALDPPNPASPDPDAAPSPDTPDQPEATPLLSRPLGPGVTIEKTAPADLTPPQQAALNRIMERYIARTPESKRQAQAYRPVLADPRTVSGFRPTWKEMIYPIVTERSSGSHLWDVDGNQYIDLTNGFGINFFGWSPPFVTEAIQKQLELGMEIGPQTPLAGRVARLLAQLTGQERVAFCNTGSEAVMAAMRLARTVTGRSTIALFAGAYHGTFDEVIVRGSSKLKSFPAAPGIMPSMVENLLVLDYGTPESLEILRQRADDLAAIMVEPVQSRHPDLQPVEFLRELRQITERSGTALIFDEVVTGFRVHPGGAQAYFNIHADLATYGKIVGGGLPIGVVAGKSNYMDALDGGFWQFGDESFPQIGVTFFAGTFVRHPLALAAAEVVLQRLIAEGSSLQHSLNDKVHQMVTDLNQFFSQVQAPIHIEHFSSIFYVTYPPEVCFGGLLFYLLREKGIHIWEHRPCFLTLAHSDQEIRQIIQSFKDSVDELQAQGLLPGSSKNGFLPSQPNGIAPSQHQPPVPGARLGRDPVGNPAWYIPDPHRLGKYLLVETITSSLT